VAKFPFGAEELRKYALMLVVLGEIRCLLGRETELERELCSPLTAVEPKWRFTKLRAGSCFRVVVDSLMPGASKRWSAWPFHAPRARVTLIRRGGKSVQ
jgi:hypothetical protein